MNDRFGYKGVKFVGKLLVLLVFFYLLNFAVIGLTAQGGRLYSSFLNQYLNYIAWWRSSILLIANGMAHILGIQSVVRGPYVLRSDHASIVIVYSCIGYNIVSFWIAFVLANEGLWKTKLLWVIGGALAITIVNSFRVALLLVAMENKWAINHFADHHTLFNIVAYLVIIIMMLIYNRNVSKLQVAYGPGNANGD